MKKRFFRLVLAVVLSVMGTGGYAASSFVSVSDTDSDGPAIVAYLFLSNSCPWCRKLKQENFPDQFRRKYAGRVNLKEYEIHTVEGRQQFSKLTKKHGLSGGVPVLIIGSTVVPGYSANMMARADDAVKKESKKQPAVKKKAPKKEDNLPAVISITLEDEELKGVAPAKDMKQIKHYLTQVQDENGETLSSMNSVFNGSVCNRAMALINDNEQKLKDLAVKSPSFAVFKKSADAVKSAQEKQLNELMRKNTKSLR